MLNDNATLVVGAGNYFRAPLGTPEPEDLLNLGPEWENLGHTSVEDIMSTESEGGEKTILATLQNSALRTRYSKRTETFGIPLQQFDTNSLKLFYGSNAITLPSGMLAPHVDPIPTQEAFLAVFIDGNSVFGIYAPKAEYFRGDDFAIEDTENLATLPISVTPMPHSGNKWAFALTPIGDSGVAQAWEAETSYSTGDEVALSGGEVLEATAAGTSGTVEPEAPASVGGTVTDGTVDWQRVA